MSNSHIVYSGEGSLFITICRLCGYIAPPSNFVVMERDSSCGVSEWVICPRCAYEEEL